MDTKTNESTNVWQSVKGKNSSKGKTILIKLGATPYEATQNYYSNNYTNQKEQTKERFRIPPPPTNLIMTKMCKSVYTNIRCAHGEKCFFAHTIEQLNPSKCAFGDDCRKTGDECGFIHPFETKIEYCVRIGVSPKEPEPKRILVPQIQKEEPPEKESVKEEPPEKESVKEEPPEKESVKEEPPEKEPVKEEPPEKEPVKEEPPEKEPVKEEPPEKEPVKEELTEEPIEVILKEKPKNSPPKEVILKVPEELAVQAFTLAMKNGYKNIKVEIV
jgi:hypothetical protein